MRPTEHLDAAEVIAYLEGRISPEERERLERHLADCAACVADVAVGTAVSRRRARPLLIAAGGLAAAAVVALVIGRSAPNVPAGPVMDERASGRQETLAIVAPQSSATLGNGEAFIWRSHPEAVTYRLTITDTTGAEVWSTTTSDTAIRAPHPPLLPARTYLWYVDVLGADGRTATTGLQRLRTAP
jgi:hypothetical protein